MSRFDKALERARSSPSGNSRFPREVMLPEGTPSDDTFETPWRVKEAVAARSDVAPAVPARSIERPAVPVRSTERPAVLRVHPAFAEKVITDGAASAVVVEQYLNLAGHLQQWQAKTGAKAVIVSSATAGDGRTLTALNLALALRSSFQQHVLLVDCDLRHPRLHEALLVDRRQGVTEAVATGRFPSPVTVSAKLSFLPAGRPSDNPTACLTSDGMAALLKQAKTEYDWVVIDTPPAADLDDAELLSPLVDGVLLVVSAGRTRADRARRVIARMGSPIIGVVLNRVAPGDMTAGDRYRAQSPR